PTDRAPRTPDIALTPGRPTRPFETTKPAQVVDPHRRFVYRPAASATARPLLLADLRHLVARVTVEGPRRGELAELVTDHVLRHEDRDELAAVVHGERERHRLGDDRAAARPGLDDLLRGLILGSQNLLHEMAVDERALLYASRHVLSALLVSTTHDHRI